MVNLKYRYAIILLVSLLIIVFPLSIYTETSTPVGDLIFFIIALSLIFGGIYLISFLITLNSYLKGVRILTNRRFLNSALILLTSFCLFEMYFLKFQFILFPSPGVYENNMQILSDDKSGDYMKLIDLSSCSNKILESKIEGRLYLVVQAINCETINLEKDSVNIVEVLYLHNNEERFVNYVRLEVTNNCDLISMTSGNDRYTNRIKYLLDRAENESKEAEKLTKEVDSLNSKNNR